MWWIIENVKLLINLGFILFLLLAFVLGYFGNVFKNIYKGIVFIGLLILGILLNGPIANLILNIKLGFLPEGTIMLTALNFEAIQNILVHPDVTAAVVGVIVMVAKLVALIVWLILMGTVFKVITLVVYIFIKPKKKYDEEGKVVKPSTLMKLLSGGIRVAKTFIIFMMFGIIIGSLMGLVTSSQNIVKSYLAAEKEENVELAYRIRIDRNGLTPFTNLADSSDTELYDIILQVCEDYKTSLYGRIFSGIEVGKGANRRTMDQVFFDWMFSINIKFEDGSKDKIRLFRDLMLVLNAADLLFEYCDFDQIQNGNISSIAYLESEVIEQLFEYISKLDLIRVMLPIGIRIAVDEETLADVDIDLEDLIKEIKKLDIEGDIKQIGISIGEILDSGFRPLLVSMSEGETPNILMYLMRDINTDLLSEAIFGFIDTSIVTKSGDMFTAIMLDSKMFTEMLESSGIDKSALDLSNDALSLSENLKSLIKAIIAIKEFDWKFEDDTFLGLTYITDEQINKLAHELAGIPLIKGNGVPVAKMLLNSLIPNGAEIIGADAIVEADWLTLLSFLQIAVNSGIIDFSSLNFEGVTITSIIMGLTDDDVETLSTTISESTLINLTKVIELFVNPLLDENIGFSIIIPDTFSWNGTSGKKEFKSIFNIARFFARTGLFEGNFDMAGYSDQDLDDLSTYLTDSVIIKTNICGVFEAVMGMVDLGDFGFEIYILTDPEEFTKFEIYSILWTARMFLSNSDDPISALVNLTNNELDIVLRSKMISISMVNFLKTQSSGEGMLAGIVDLSGIESDDEYYSIYNTLGICIYDGEIKRFFVALQALFGAVSIDINDLNIEPSMLFDLSETTFVDIINSKIFRYTLIQVISTIDIVDTTNVEIESYWYKDEGGVVTGELIALFRALKIVLNYISLDSGDDPVDGIMSMFSELDDASIKTIAASIVICDTIYKMIDENGGDFLCIPDYHVDKYGDDGEILHFIKAMKIIVESLDGDELDLESVSGITMGTIINEKATLLASEIISNTIISELKKMSSDSEFGFLLPNEYSNNPGNTNWKIPNYSDGELGSLLVAISLFVSDDSSFNSDEFAYDQDKILHLTDDERADVIKSYLMSYNIVDIVIKESDKPNPIFYVPTLYQNRNEVLWYGSLNELDRFLLQLKILNRNDPHATLVDIDITFENVSEVIDNLLLSYVMEESIIQYLNDYINTNSSFIKKPDVWNETEWYTVYDIDRNILVVSETSKLINAVYLITGGLVPTQSTFDVLTFYDGDSINETVYIPAMSSRVMSASIVYQVEVVATKPGSGIHIPSGMVEEDWRGNDSTAPLYDGEIRKLLVAVYEMSVDHTINGIEFDINKIIKKGVDITGEYLIFRSRIIEYSAIEYILNNPIDGDEYIIPSSIDPTFYYFHGSYMELNWYKTPTERGELRLVLDALTAILDTGTTDGDSKPIYNDYDSVTYDMEIFYNKDFNTILRSRTMEASIANMVLDILTRTDTLGLGNYIEPSSNIPFGYLLYIDENATDGAATLKMTGDLIGLLNALDTMSKTDLKSTTSSVYDVSVQTIYTTMLSIDGKSNLLKALFDDSRIIRYSNSKLFTKFITDAFIAVGITNLVLIETILTNAGFASYYVLDASATLGFRIVINDKTDLSNCLDNVVILHGLLP